MIRYLQKQVTWKLVLENVATIWCASYKVRVIKLIVRIIVAGIIAKHLLQWSHMCHGVSNHRSSTVCSPKKTSKLLISDPLRWESLIEGHDKYLRAVMSLCHPIWCCVVIHRTKRQCFAAYVHCLFYCNVSNNLVGFNVRRMVDMAFKLAYCTQEILLPSRYV